MKGQPLFERGACLQPAERLRQGLRVRRKLDIGQTRYPITPSEFDISTRACLQSLNP